VKEGDTMIDGKDVRTVLLESKLENYFLNITNLLIIF